MTVESYIGMDRAWVWISLAILLHVLYLDWGKYWNKFRVRNILIRYTHGNEAWQEKQISLKNGLLHDLSFSDQGMLNIIEIDKKYRIKFNDSASAKFWWEQTDGDFRRYQSGPFAQGHGFKDVFFILERIE